MEIAKIKSTKSSSRIEAIFKTDKRLEELMSQKSEPRSRNEQEIPGYRNVLSTIHESYDYITPTTNIILQLHRDLYSYSKNVFGGKFKSSDDGNGRMNRLLTLLLLYRSVIIVGKYMSLEMLIESEKETYYEA